MLQVNDTLSQMGQTSTNRNTFIKQPADMFSKLMSKRVFATFPCHCCLCLSLYKLSIKGLSFFIWISKSLIDLLFNINTCLGMMYELIKYTYSMLYLLIRMFMFYKLCVTFFYKGKKNMTKNYVFVSHYDYQLLRIV